MPLMFRFSGVCCACLRPLRRRARGGAHSGRQMWRGWIFWLMAATVLRWAVPAAAVVLWSDLGATLVHETGAGNDILGGALKRDDTASDTLYFKFHVGPLSDVGTEEYFAAFQLYEGDVERLAVGNSLKAWAYSAFNTATNGEFNKVFGDMDLRSSQPESSSPGVFLPYELPRRGIERTIVFKVQYVPGGDDLVTVWLNPDLTPGATEAGQPESLRTAFSANASFNAIHLRQSGGGGGWTFSDMEIATTFSDLVSPGSTAPGGAAPGAGGASRSAGLTFRSWQREQGLPQNSVKALAQTRDGYLWIGSDDGVVRFDGVRFVSFGLREGLPSGPVRTLFEDRQGTLWIGSADSGLTRWQEGQFTTFTTRDGLPADAITALAEDNEGRLWVGTEAGLVVWQKGQLAPPPGGAEPFKSRPITTLCKDRQGVLWLGATGAGIFRLVEGKFVALADASVEGLLQDPHCLLEDKAGRIWLGAGDDFVLCRDGDQWRRYRIPRHLARPYVSALAEEPDGTVWAGSVSEGLFQFTEGKLAAISASSGLLDNSVESLLVDREGNLWVGTGAGLQRLRRSNLLNAPPPTVVLEETMIDEVAADMRRPQAAGGESPGANRLAPAEGFEIRVPPGKHRVEFRYTGISFGSPEGVRFRYRLEPLDSDWVEAKERRVAFYSYVPPGQYRFRVIACDSGGKWNEAGASVTLVVLRHWWQTWWLIGLPALGLMASVAGAVRIAEKRKLQRHLKLLEQERALEHERARIAQDLHDDLGSSLTRISLLSDLARTDRDNASQVEAHLQKISQSAGQSVRALEEIVWALRPGSDSLQSLVEYIAHFANELFEGDSARCRLDLPHDLPTHSLPPEMRHSIFLVVKEALTNALKHSHAREVRVQAKATAKVLEIVVQDDGQGFEARALPPTSAKRHGLGNMRRRAEDMGGRLTVESGRGKGTTVRLSVSFPA